MLTRHALVIMVHHFEEYDHAPEVNEAFETLKTAVLAQQPITGDKTQKTPPEGDITPDCSTCRIRRSICPHKCSSEGCRSIYVPE